MAPRVFEERSGDDERTRRANRREGFDCQRGTLGFEHGQLGRFRPGGGDIGLELPQLPVVAATVCSDDQALLRPLLDSHPNVRARYWPAAACPPTIAEGIAIYDRTAPAQPPAVPAIYIEPPANRSPVRIAKAAAAASIHGWLTSHPVAAGVRAPDLRLDAAQVFAPDPGDARIAESAEGPVIVAREKGRVVVLGFHPTRSNVRFELAVPLLFANILRWMAPASFQRWELYAESVPRERLVARLGAHHDRRLEAASVEGAREPCDVDLGATEERRIDHVTDPDHGAPPPTTRSETTRRAHERPE